MNADIEHRMEDMNVKFNYKYQYNGYKLPKNIVNKVNYLIKREKLDISFDECLRMMMDRGEIVHKGKNKWEVFKRNRVRRAPYKTRKKQETVIQSLATGAYKVKHVTRDVFASIQKIHALRFSSHVKNYQLPVGLVAAAETAYDEDQDFSEDSLD